MSMLCQCRGITVVRLRVRFLVALIIVTLGEVPLMADQKCRLDRNSFPDSVMLWGLVAASVVKTWLYESGSSCAVFVSVASGEVVGVSSAPSVVYTVGCGPDGPVSGIASVVSLRNGVCGTKTASVNVEMLCYTEATCFSQQSVFSHPLHSRRQLEGKTQNKL